MLSVEIDYICFQEPSTMRQVVKEFFKKHFEKRLMIKANSIQLKFKQLEDGYATMLIETFSKEEIKKVVWNCDSSKSQGQMVLTSAF